MHNRLQHGLNEYVLSPFGGAPAFGDPDWGNIIGGIGTGVGGILGGLFGNRTPTAFPVQPSTGMTDNQLLRMQEQQAAAAAANKSQQTMLYVGGGVAALIFLGVMIRR